MTPTLQAAIDKRNQQTAIDRKRVFAKKANDQDHHLNLFKTVDVFLEAYRIDPASGNARAAFKEMSAAMALSRRRLQP